MDLLRERARRSQAHQVVESAEQAELNLLVGSFGQRPELLLDHPRYKARPDACAVYTEDDSYLPLAPGVYCSAHPDEHSRIGRIFSYTYVSRNGYYSNSFLAETSAENDNVVPPEGAFAQPEKRYLFSFQGASTSMLRKRLFKMDFDRDDVFIQNTSHYFHWDDSQPDRREQQRRYAETLAASSFVLCPRGAGAGSIRLFEVMAAGIAPVLLSDDYALPPGPDWESFLIRVPERDVARLPKLLEAERETASRRGELAKRAFEEHFATALEFDRIVELAALSLRHGGPAEAEFRKRQKAMMRVFFGKQHLRDIARNTFLKTLKVLRLPNPYQLNR